MSKKDIVVEIARNLFSKYGYKKVSMDEVAKGAGVTKKTIYTYFKDKESMFKYFIDEELQIMKDELEKLEKSDLSFAEYVSKGIHYMVDYTNKSDLFKGIKNSINQYEDNAFVKIYETEIINYIESKINDAIKSKKINNCDSHLVAFILYKVYVAILFEYDRDINHDIVINDITSIIENRLCCKGDNESILGSIWQRQY